MRRILLAVFATGLIMLMAAPADAAVVPANATFRGMSLTAWQRDYMRWATGSAASPVVAGGCGAIGAKGVFYLAPAASPGTTVLDCDIPVGTPVLALVDVAFSEIPTWGANDAEVHADALATFQGFQDVTVTLDGAAVPLDGVVRDAGVYDVAIETGSVFDLECDGAPLPCKGDFVPPGPVRMATIGRFLVLTPMSPGDHEFDVTANFFGTPLDLEVHLHVG